MIDLRIKIDSKELGQALARLVRGLPDEGDFTPVTSTWARILKAGTQMRFRAQRAPDGTPWKKSRRAEEEGGQTLSDTRRLRNSITSAFNRQQAAVGTNVIYAAAQHFGATIKPKKGPFLAVPVTNTARAAGSPRNMPGLKVWQTPNGQFVMGDDTGKVHFLLRISVTLPARPFLGASESDAAQLREALQRHLQGNWGG